MYLPNGPLLYKGICEITTALVHLSVSVQNPQGKSKRVEMKDILHRNLLLSPKPNETIVQERGSVRLWKNVAKCFGKGKQLLSFLTVFGKAKSRNKETRIFILQGLHGSL